MRRNTCYARQSSRIKTKHANIMNLLQKAQPPHPSPEQQALSPEKRALSLEKRAPSRFTTQRAPSLDSRAPSPEKQALPCFTTQPPRVITYYRRYRGYDYSRGASLFITISIEPRQPLFGRVKDAAVELTQLGMAVAEAIAAIPLFNPAITLFEWVVMPDHVHFNIHLAANLDDPLKTLGAAIRKFKTYTTTMARKLLGLNSLWQQGYHDYLLLHSQYGIIFSNVSKTPCQARRLHRSAVPMNKRDKIIIYSVYTHYGNNAS